MGFRKTLKIFYHYYRTDRWKILFGLVCLLFVDVLVAVQPRILKWFVDEVTLLFSLDSSVGAENRYAPFIWIGSVYAGAAILQGMFRYGWRNFIVRSSHRAAERIRAEYFAKLQKLPPSFYDQQPIGDLMALGLSATWFQRGKSSKIR